MLYNNLATPDRSKTQLAQRIKYFPWANLSEAGRKLVTAHHIKVMSCREIEDELIRHPDFHEVFALEGRASLRGGVGIQHDPYENRVGTAWT